MNNMKVTKEHLFYAAILGAVLWIVSEFLEMASVERQNPLSLWLTTIWHPVIAAGYWGLHKYQSPERNILSLTGVLLLILSFVVFAPASMIILYGPVESFAELMQQYPVFQVAGFISVIGNIVFGIAIIRTHSYPAWTGYGILIAIVLGVVQNIAGLPVLVQHIAFISLALIVINMAVYALRHAQIKRQSVQGVH